MKPPHKPGYRIHEWEDETSMFDPEARWEGECYYRSYRCYVPVRLKEENFNSWLDNNFDRVVWINRDGTVAVVGERRLRG